MAELERFHAGRGDPCRDTGAGLWVGSDPQEVHQAFAMLGLENYRHLADLGSGDGRVVMIASLFTQATGIEASPELTRAARDMAARLKLPRTRFLTQDYRQANLAEYDLLFAYPDKPLDWLDPLLPTGWPGCILVYGPKFTPPNSRLLQEIKVNKNYFRLWGK